MTQVTLKGNPVDLAGKLVQVGDKLDAELVLTNKDLTDVKLGSFDAKALVLSLFPSVDTGVCAFSVTEFNNRFNSVAGVKVLNVSADLPFALGRFCGDKGLDNVETLSTFRSPNFAQALGLKLANGPLAGLCARAVLVLDSNLEVKYFELSSEIGEHLNYDNVAKAVEALAA